jgi:tetratricopeptide (TPR) repeat protein
MDASEHVDEILAEWQEQHARGDTTPPEHVVAAHPECAQELRARFRALSILDPTLSLPQGTPSRIGEFRILREIDRGGMGVVYEAEQTSMRRKVALKVLSSAITGTRRAVERFRREAQAAGRLHHTNIVPIYGLGRHGGYWYYTMELVEGRSLGEVLAAMRCGAPPPASELVRDTRTGSRTYYAGVAEMFAGVAEGLHQAHESGVVHRDLKPSNLLLDADGTIKIIDFGLAFMADDAAAVTMTGDLLGTPVYMSPEQATGRRDAIDRRTDVYSLAATLYEVLTLKAPFEGGNLQELCAKIAAKDPVPPRRHESRVPGDLETIVLKAMAKRRRRRYATALEFARDLRRFAEGGTIHARRIGPIGRAWRRVRRHKAISALAAGLLVAVAVSAFFVHRALEEARSHRELSYADLCRRAEDSVIYGRFPRYGPEWEGPFAGSGSPREDARALLSEAIALLPERVDAYVLRVLAPGGEFEERWADLQQAKACGLEPRLFHLLHGAILTTDQRHPEAAAAYEKARAYAGESGTSAAIEAMILVARGERTEAERLITRAIESGELSPILKPRAYRLRARLRRLRGEWEDTLADLAVLQSLEPSVGTRGEIAFVSRRNDSPAAERRFQEALDSARAAGTEQAWKDLCDAVRYQEDWHARVAEAALENYPEAIDIVYEQHLVLERKHDPDGLLELAERARETWPDRSKSYEMLAKAFEKKRETEKALDAWSRAIDLADSGKAHLGYLKAMLLRRLGRFREALEAYDDALRVDPTSGPNLFSRATLLVEMGQPAEGQRAFQEALQARPGDAQGLGIWGVMLNNYLNKPVEALEYFDKALDAFPNLARTHENRGIVLRRLGKREEALGAFEESLRLDPDAGKTHWHRINLLRRLRGAEAALEAVDEVIQEHPDDHAVVFWCGNATVACGRVDKGMAVMKRSLEAEPDANRMLLYAGRLWHFGQRDEAKRIWKQLIEDPDPRIRADALCDRGTVHEHIDPDAALRDFQQAVKEFPRHAVAWANAAVILRRKKRLDEALAAHRKAIEIEPFRGQWWCGLVPIYRAMKRPADMRAAVDKAVEVDPLDPGMHFARGRTLYELKDANEAEKAYRTALDLNPSYAPAYFWLGAIHEDRSDWDKAIDVYRKAYELDPSNKHALMHEMAILKRKTRRFEDAAKRLEQVLAKYPRNYWARFELGMIYGDNLDRQEDSLRVFRECAKLNPKDVEARANIGLALWKLGRGDEAIAAYRKAREINPDYAGIPFTLGQRYLDLHRYEPAVKCFTDAIEAMKRAKRPDEGFIQMCRYWRGWTLREMGELGKALAEQQALAGEAAEDPSSRAEAALILAMLGRFDEAREPLEAALRLGGDWDTREKRAQTLCLMGEYDEAVKAARELMTIFFNGNPETLLYCLRAAGHADEAKAIAQKAAEREDLPGSPIYCAYVYAVAGLPERVRAIYDAYDYPWVHSLMLVRARTHAVLGEQDAALEWLEKAAAAGLRLPLPDPEFRDLANDARYRKLLHCLKGG